MHKWYLSKSGTAMREDEHPTAKIKSTRPKVTMRCTPRRSNRYAVPYPILVRVVALLRDWLTWLLASRWNWSPSIIPLMMCMECDSGGLHCVQEERIACSSSSQTNDDIHSSFLGPRAEKVS